MSSDEIRLWRDSLGSFVRDSVFGAATHIAVPAAKHAALMRVVEAALKQREAAREAFHARGADRLSAERAHESACEATQNAATDYLATAPGRQGEAPRE